MPATVPLAAAPDYVRFVPSTRELWVTELQFDTAVIATGGADIRRLAAPFRQLGVFAP